MNIKYTIKMIYGGQVIEKRSVKECMEAVIRHYIKTRQIRALELPW